jgi:hypothetical protein
VLAQRVDVGDRPQLEQNRPRSRSHECGTPHCARALAR